MANQATASDPKSKLSELNEAYREAEACDKELFSEQRSNILLIAGDHYSKKTNSGFNTIRSRADIPQNEKIRLTKNHVQKIVKIYVNNIVTAAPGVVIRPKDPKDNQSKKSAELRQKIWEHCKKTHRMREKIRDWCEDYVGIGEVAVKIFFDPNLGKLMGYRAAQGEDGQDQTDAQGNLVASETPVFSGDFVFERIYGFNLLRSPEAKDFNDSNYVIVRKMVDVKKLKKQYAAQPEIADKLNAGEDRTFVIFDAQKGNYGRVKNQVMLREHYYRPSMTYPNGYFYISTDDVILEEGELPEGVFPIVYTGFEKIPTSARGRGPVKHMRPYQAEINRSASKMAEHQITLGDDKIISVNGAKLSEGATLPGIRHMTSSGGAPAILSGRDGSQYLAYMQSQIAELYEVMCVNESLVDKTGDVDPYALLFKSASQKKAFSAYIQRFEQFLNDVCDVFTQLAPKYFDDQTLVEICGKDEFANIPELRNPTETKFVIALDNVSDDIETMLGKQLVMTQALQYAGGQLSKEDIGKILRGMPFADADDSFSDLTLNFDTAENVILALDRGAPPMVHTYDDHEYMIQKLTNRVRKPDFELLSPQVKQSYDQAISLHEQADAQQKAAALAAKSEYIPIDGALIVCDMYVQDPAHPGESKRVRVPYGALNWLIQQLSSQGNDIASLDQLNPVNGTHIIQRAAGLAHPGQQPGQAPTSQPVQPANVGGGNMPVMPGQALG